MGEGGRGGGEDSGDDREEATTQLHSTPDTATPDTTAREDRTAMDMEDEEMNEMIDLGKKQAQDGGTIRKTTAMETRTGRRGISRASRR